MSTTPVSNTPLTDALTPLEIECKLSDYAYLKREQERIKGFTVHHLVQHAEGLVNGDIDSLLEAGDGEEYLRYILDNVATHNHFDLLHFLQNDTKLGFRVDDDCLPTCADIYAIVTNNLDRKVMDGAREMLRELYNGGDNEYQDKANHEQDSINNLEDTLTDNDLNEVEVINVMSNIDAAQELQTEYQEKADSLAKFA